jgi:hypothetical protein
MIPHERLLDWACQTRKGPGRRVGGACKGGREARRFSESGKALAWRLAIGRASRTIRVNERMPGVVRRALPYRGGLALARWACQRPRPRPCPRRTQGNRRACRAPRPGTRPHFRVMTHRKGKGSRSAISRVAWSMAGFPLRCPEGWTRWGVPWSIDPNHPQLASPS